MRHNDVPISMLLCDGFHGVDYHDNYSVPNSPLGTIGIPYTPCTPGADNSTNSSTSDTPCTPCENSSNKSFAQNKFKKSPTDPNITNCDICNGIMATNIKHVDIPKLLFCTDLHGYDYHNNPNNLKK